VPTDVLAQTLRKMTETAEKAKRKHRALDIFASVPIKARRPFAGSF
jgi:hypothetical protein